MQKLMFPTSQDIYIEVNGKKLAVVEQYRAKAVRQQRVVEAFGENQPAGVTTGGVRYTLELSRVYYSEAAGDGVSFYALAGFNVVVVKPDRRIVFTGCQWSEICESAGINDTVLESVTLTAARRLELPRMAEVE